VERRGDPHGAQQYCVLRSGPCGWTLRHREWRHDGEGVEGELAGVWCVERRGDPHGARQLRVLRGGPCGWTPRHRECRQDGEGVGVGGLKYGN